ncbi:MAG TPA: phosphoglycerate mutase family protein [Acidimicrobiales bacterium]|nr:phosphoglycerate mutase family protein [Acidimicrobiales bacterium]
MTLLLIRHGHAGSRKEWTGDDRLRPLSAKGRRQARALVHQLEPWPPSRVLSSPYRRCVDTVKPLAHDLGLKVEEVDELAEGAGWDAVELVRGLHDSHVALCTHGDVIPEILVALADEDRLDLGPAPRQAKGSTWVLRSARGRFLDATYVPPRS